jgi:chromosome segregation ATPase
MWKKLTVGAIVGVAVLALLSFTFGARRVKSYISTACAKFVDGAQSEVPLEFEIERLKHETAQLTPDMRKHLSVIAEEMVAVDNLKKDIADEHLQQDARKRNILSMKEDLKSGQEKVSYDGRTYSARRVKEKLVQDLAAYDRCEKELANKERLLEAREKALDAAREQLAVMKSRKQELEIKLAELEAKVKTLRLAQSESKVQLDDSRLAHINASIAEIENRLKVDEKTVELQDKYLSDPIPVEKKEKSTDQLIKDVENHFGPSKTEGRVAERK